MKNQTYKYLYFFFIFSFIYSCTKDDICPPDTATTPGLVITFKDIANPANAKKVNVLSVLTNSIDSIEVVRFANTDSIKIPLNTNSDTTKYIFKYSIISANDTVKNFDKIMFVYQRRNGYVNRACGFKTEYFNIEAELENEGTENWIKELIIKRDTVNDENSAHITMLH